MKGKTSISLDLIFRMLLVLFVIIQQSSLVTTVDSKIVTMYIVLSVYALAFSLLEKNKWIILIEMVIVVALAEYYHQTYLYYLLPVLYTKYLNQFGFLYDYIAVWLLTTGAIFIRTDNMIITAILGVGVLASIVSFTQRSKKIEYLEEELKKERKQNSIYKSEIYEQRRELEVAARMSEQSRRLTEIIKLEDIVERMLEASKWIFHADYVCLYVRHEKYYKLIRELGDGEKYNVPQSLKLVDGEKPRIEQRMMQFPIKQGNAYWGTLCLFNKRAEVGGKQKIPFPFEEGDYEVLSIYISQAMLQMKNAKAMKEIKDLANYDFLTGVPNRRFFINQTEYLIERARRGEELSVFLIDVDNFKKFNDRYGHETGDQVLIAVAETLKASTRKIDVVARYGGEEFAVVLPNARENAPLIAERIRKRIKTIKIIEDEVITISLGVSHFGSGGNTIDQILNSADEALYQAKNSGKDRVIVYGEE